MVEIGGTVGDIESLPFLEAIRQLGVELGRNNCVYMHLTLVPIVGGSGEIKTKPTQHSVKELRGIGIQPDVLLCRCKHPLPEEQRRKIALFTNVEERAVISAVDADDIYKIPLLLHEQGLDDIVVDKLRLEVPADRPGRVAPGGQRARPTPTARSTSPWSASTCRSATPTCRCNEALMHGGLKTRTRVNIHYIESTDIEQRGTHAAAGMDAILVPGGFGERGIEGKIQAVRYAREQRHAVPRHLPRHAGGDRRVRPPRARAHRRQQHRVQPRHPASGHRADLRVAGPGARRADAHRGLGDGRHHAPRARRRCCSGPARVRASSTAAT